MRWLALLVSLWAAACGDSGGDPDAGPIFDARRYTDADVVSCAADGDEVCAELPFTPVCDEARGVCVECAGDGDCDGADTFGPDCRDDATCACSSEQDCEGNRNGPRCHEVVAACTCIDDRDCGEDEDCKMEPYLGAGVRTCNPL